MGVVEVDGQIAIPETKWEEASGYLILPIPLSEKDAACQVVGDLIPGEWVNARLISIKPGGFIHLHTDPPNDATKGRARYHWVLKTNPYCWNYHDGAIQHLDEGGVYEVDEKIEHASVNWGKTPRVHLVIDVKVAK